MQIRKEQLPWVMSGGRAMLGPVLVVGEKCGWSGAGLAALVVTALLSDIFDGVLARRWKCDTAGVRLFDSMADAVFYMCAGIALWIGQPQIWRDNAGLLAAVLGLEAVRYAVEFWKFGKPASYHSYLAKAWGLVLATGIVAAFALGRSNPVLVAGLALGIVSNLEGLAMSLVLPVWHKDLKTLKAALAVREQVRGSSFGIQGEGVRAALVGKAAVAVVLLAMTMPAFAADPVIEATYSGGTARIAAETPGTLDATSAKDLVFRAKTGGEVSIPYAKIRSYEPRHDVVRHLGFLPAVAAGLVAARQRTYTVAISYADDTGGTQLVVVRTTERDQRELQMILRARATDACMVKEYGPVCGIARPPTPAVSVATR